MIAYSRDMETQQVMIGPFRSTTFARRLCASSLLAFAAASSLQAAPLNIGATASVVADLDINSGLIPDDIAGSTGVPTALSGTVDSALDDPAGAQTDDVFTQVGNPFTVPPTPFITTSFDETALPGGDAARGFYYVESTLTPESTTSGKPIAMDRVLNGTATLNFSDLDADASASGDYQIGRYLTLSNTSATTAYVFSISTGFDIALSASADTLGSESVAEAAFSVSFISSGSVQISGGTPFADSRTVDDADPGTAVVDSLVTSNALFDGVLYQASVSAIGTGAPTESSLHAASRFLFTVQMDPGSTLGVTFFQSHETRTSFTAAPGVGVPLPGTALILLAGFAALGTRRFRRR